MYGFSPVAVETPEICGAEAKEIIMVTWFNIFRWPFSAVTLPVTGERQGRRSLPANNTIRVRLSQLRLRAL